MPIPLVDQVVPATQRDTPVEPWPGAVVNPTIGSSASAVWDPDDQDNLLLVDRSLAAGATATFTAYLIANPNPINGFSWATHPRFYISVQSPDVLEVTAEYHPQALSFRLAGVTSGKITTYTGALSGPVYDPASPAVVPIAGSGGGSGVQGMLAIVVHNATTKSQRGISVVVRGGNDQDQLPGVSPTQMPGPGFALWTQGPWTQL